MPSYVWQYLSYFKNHLYFKLEYNKFLNEIQKEVKALINSNKQFKMLWINRGKEKNIYLKKSSIGSSVEVISWDYFCFSVTFQGVEFCIRWVWHAESFTCDEIYMHWVLYAKSFTRGEFIFRRVLVRWVLLRWVEVARIFKIIS